MSREPTTAGDWVSKPNVRDRWRDTIFNTRSKNKNDFNAATFLTVRETEFGITVAKKHRKLAWIAELSTIEWV
jgi:hypothetical protein